MEALVGPQMTKIASARTRERDRKGDGRAEERERANTRITSAKKHLPMALSFSKPTWRNDRRINR